MRQAVAVHSHGSQDCSEGGAQEGFRQKKQNRCEEFSTEVVFFRSTEPKGCNLPTEYDTDFVLTWFLQFVLSTV